MRNATKHADDTDHATHRRYNAGGQRTSAISSSPPANPQPSHNASDQARNLLRFDSTACFFNINARRLVRFFLGTSFMADSPTLETLSPLPEN